jgi:hypothetical protein
MAYDQVKLVVDVRMFLGGISEEDLADTTILYYGDLIDSNPKYTGDYPYILWKTTLCCIEYLKAQAIQGSVGNSTKSSTKEKVGDVQFDTSNEYNSIEDILNAWDSLYGDYLENPYKFGIIVDNTSVVLIGGVNQEQVDGFRGNKSTTSIYNPLPVTAFPKCSTYPYNRRKRK